MKYFRWQGLNSDIKITADNNDTASEEATKETQFKIKANPP